MKIGHTSRDMPINHEFHDEIVRAERSGFDVDLKLSCGNSSPASRDKASMHYVEAQGQASATGAWLVSRSQTLPSYGRKALATQD